VKKCLSKIKLISIEHYLVAAHFTDR